MISLFQANRSPVPKLPVSASVSRHKTPAADAAPVGGKRLAQDMFFSGRKQVETPQTAELLKKVSNPGHCLTPEQLHEEVLSLLSQGADPHYVDKDGKTAADHLETLKLYSKGQYADACRQYDDLADCGYSFTFNIAHYVPQPELKPLPKTIEVLREWAVNEGAASWRGNASNTDENTPLLAQRKTSYTALRK